MKKAIWISLLLLGIFLFWHHVFGIFWFAKANKRLALLSSEYEPMQQTAISVNGHAPLPPNIRGYVEEGQPVFVLWDVYGKDYWACYIFTKTGKNGWVLCTDLRRGTDR